MMTTLKITILEIMMNHDNKDEDIAPWKGRAYVEYIVVDMQVAASIQTSADSLLTSTDSRGLLLTLFRLLLTLY